MSTATTSSHPADKGAAQSAAARVTSSDRRRDHQGTALFSHGFRPFFLGGALWAALITPLWVMAFSGRQPLPFALDAFDWHRHEMIFGWLSAVVAGFLLTAVPNWTGRLPVVGARLKALAGLWLAGRLALALGGALGEADFAVWAALIAVIFPLAMSAMIWREVTAGGNRRNIPVCVLISLYALGDGLFLAGAVGWPGGQTDTLEWGVRLGLAAIIALIVLIGGRVTPSFTRNWLTKRGEDRLPPDFDRLDKVAMVVTLAVLGLWLALPELTITGIALILAGLATGLRLSRWGGLPVWREPLVAVLHAGYGFTALGLALMGVNVLAPGLVGGPHGVAVGGIGLMTLGIMTRATLGHSGRSLSVGLGTVTIYLAVGLAAVTRIIAAAVPGAYIPLIHSSAMLWSLGFGLYLIIYGPMLVKARVGHV